LCRARSTASTAPTLLPLLRSPQAAARRLLLLELRGLAQSRFEPLHPAFLRNTIESAAELLEVRRQGPAAEAARLEQGDEALQVEAAQEWDLQDQLADLDLVPVSLGEESRRIRGVLLVGRQVEPERVRDPVDQVEERADVQGVHELLGRDAGGRACLAGAQRHVSEEAKRVAQLLLERGALEIRERRCDDLVTECVRRDRAVRARSERALVLRRDERCEQLALPD
jgi:hypothetical protein